MGVVIKPTSVIKARLGLEPNGKVQSYFTSTCQKHMDKYVPYSGDGKGTVHLRENIELQTDIIIYKSSYAHAQYVGFTTGEVKNYTTPRNRKILG